MKTKYGNATINKEGYYKITSTKEGNHNKYLHRLIFEDYHNCKLDKNDIIHHIDNNPLNNHPTNLTCMSRKAHQILHTIYKTRSDETRRKKSKCNNTTGYLNVCKQKGKQYKQGFIWKYTYTENDKRKAIERVDLEKLELEVKSRGLPWEKFKED